MFVEDFKKNPCIISPSRVRQAPLSISYERSPLPPRRNLLTFPTAVADESKSDNQKNENYKEEDHEKYKPPLFVEDSRLFFGATCNIRHSEPL